MSANEAKNQEIPRSLNISKTKITEMLLVLFVLMLVPALAMADQKKNNPPPPPKPAPAAKTAAAPKQAQPAARPVQRPAAQPARVQPGNTGVRPAGGAGANPNVRPGVGNPNVRPGAASPNMRPGVVTPNVRPGVVSPTSGRPGAPTPTRSVPTRNGHVEVAANNKPRHFVGNHGQEAHFGNRGQIRDVRDPSRGMRVERGLRPGDRRVESIDRNGHRLVSMGPHRGFVERPYYRDRYGHAYVQRTYWVHGHAYAYAYRDHFYHDVHYYRYVPGYYYRPAFYGWAYNPWAAPVYYNWGWGPAPWFYGGYFAPAPYYPTASLWLTDFLLSENLKQAYEARQEAAASPDAQANAEAYQQGEQPPPEGGSAAATSMDPHVKEMIDAEVHRQLEREQAAAQSPQAQPMGDEAPPPALDPKQRLFVVSSNLGVSTAEGQECELTPGDVITRIENTPGTDGKVEVSVMSSKGNDCGIGFSPRVAVNDLQEMHNSFRQQLDAGLDALAKSSGTGGLPKAPDTKTSVGEAPPPAPDKNVDTQLNDQQKEATQLEAEVRQEVQTAPAR